MSCRAGCALAHRGVTAGFMSGITGEMLDNSISVAPPSICKLVGEVARHFKADDIDTFGRSSATTYLFSVSTVGPPFHPLRRHA